jgi:hypothetical protein
MKMWRKVVLFGAVAATVSMVDAAVANAYDTIDYGTNQGACRAAEKQLRAAGIRYANCYETGPGHYSLAWDD